MTNPPTLKNSHTPRRTLSILKNLSKIPSNRREMVPHYHTFVECLREEAPRLENGSRGHLRVDSRKEGQRVRVLGTD